MKEFGRSWTKAYDWLNSFLRQTLKRILEAPEKLEESGKILGKDLWVKAHSKIHHWTNLKRDCADWIKWLECDNNLEIAWTDLEWKDEPSEVSSALKNEGISRSEWLRGAPAWENIWNEEKIWSTKLELNPPKKKENEEWWTQAPLVSSWESPDKNIDGTEWRDFPSIKGYLIKKS